MKKSTRVRPLHAVRQQGKSAMLASMYGTYGNVASPFQPHWITREHPLQYAAGFTFKGFEKQLGNVPLYSVANKTLSEVIRRNTRVPHTTVYYSELDLIHSSVRADLVALAWVRRIKQPELEQAVATMLMLGREVVVLRVFEP